MEVPLPRLPRERLKILTDADTGADDAVSILLGCALADVLAISCTDGNVPAAVATDNTLRLLEAAGFAADSDAIVAQGLTWPTSQGRHWGRDFNDIFPTAPARVVSRSPAHEVLVETALKQEGELLTLVCTGPLQNVGEALRHAEKLGQLEAFVSRFSKVVIMGGLCNPHSWDGQLPNHAEFNIRACVDDCRDVWAAPWPDTVEFVLVPLDPIARTPLLWADVRRVEVLAQSGTARRAAACWSVLDKHVRQDEAMLKSRGLEVYDAFAMAVALDPAVAQREAHAEVSQLPHSEPSSSLSGRSNRDGNREYHHEIKCRD